MSGLSFAGTAFAAPFALCPKNPHYFQWHGRPTVLITSGEHYGALINLDFDFRKYLDTLAAAGLNYTRIFSGAYVEPDGAFKIEKNTLAPLPDRFLCPWARSRPTGDAPGGGPFDLNQWDARYFARLKDLVAYAAKKRIVVELTLFCPMYDDLQWRLSPMNAVNNVNHVGAISRTNVYTLDQSGELLAVQETLTRKLVTELNRFDNVFFELCNEPYFGGVTVPWQHHLADVIVETERGLPARHLIAQNIANRSARISAPHPAVSLFNFHYAAPPETVAMNYALDRVLGDDETGFRGTNDVPYRIEAWDFILAGGGLFNHLDYSFVVGHEDGTFVYPATQPGGGNPRFRSQLGILSRFIRGFHFAQMRPDNSVIRGGVPNGVTVRALVQAGRAMAIYLHQTDPTLASPTLLQIELPSGLWRAEWMDTKTGKVIRRERVSGGAVREITVPSYETDVALGLRKL